MRSRMFSALMVCLLVTFALPIPAPARAPDVAGIGGSASVSVKTQDEQARGIKLPASCTNPAGGAALFYLEQDDGPKLRGWYRCEGGVYVAFNFASGTSVGAGAGPLCYANDQAGADLGAKINACDTLLGSNGGTIWAHPAGGALGTITTRIVLSGGHVLRFAPGNYPSTYVDPTPGTYTNIEGIIQLKQNSSLICEPGAVLNESTSANGAGSTSTDTLTLIKDYEGANSNGAFTQNIHIKGCTIRGAADFFNSGITTVRLGNCHNCSVTDMTLDRTNALGIIIGGGSMSGYYARNVKVEGNTLIGVAAQPLGAVNGSNIQINNNKIVGIGAAALTNAIGLPYRNGAPGAVAIDIETNTGTDRVDNIEITNNLIDNRQAPTTVCGGGDVCALHGIVAQASAGISSEEQSVFIARNTLIFSDFTETVQNVKGAGILVKMKNVTSEGNYIQKARWGIQYSTNTQPADNYLIKNNTILASGSVGGTAILIEGGSINYGSIIGNTCYGHPLSGTNFQEDCDLVNNSTGGTGGEISGNYMGGYVGSTSTIATNIATQKIGLNWVLGVPTVQTGGLVTPKLLGRGSAPTCAVGGGAGEGATCSVTGTDLGGKLTVTTSPADTPGPVATVTFASAHTNAPAVTITPAGTGPLINGGFYVTTTTTGFTVHTIITGGGEVLDWHYQVIGR